MELHERIRFLRKEHLGLSRVAFGERLGVSESVIVNLEYDRLARPEQQLPLLMLMCAKFGVNEDWLLRGEGEMLSSNDLLEQLVHQHGLTDDMRILLKRIIELPEDAQDIVAQFIHDTAQEFETAAADKQIEERKAATAEKFGEVKSATAEAEAAYIKSRSDAVHSAGSSASITTGAAG